MAEALGIAAHLDLSESHVGVASLPFEEGSRRSPDSEPRPLKRLKRLKKK